MSWLSDLYTSICCIILSAHLTRVYLLSLCITAVLLDENLKLFFLSAYFSFGTRSERSWEISWAEEAFPAGDSVSMWVFLTMRAQLSGCPVALVSTCLKKVIGLRCISSSLHFYIRLKLVFTSRLRWSFCFPNLSAAAAFLLTINPTRLCAGLD